MTSGSFPRALLIIPARDEAGNIAAVVERACNAGVDFDVLVINDGSTDATPQEARRAGAFVVDLPFNLGIGGAIQTGFKFAARHGYDLVCRVDGDGQHDPAHLAALLAPVLAGEADIVIGSRYVDRSVVIDADGYVASPPRALGIKLFAALVSLLIRRHVTDTTSGFQACNAEVAAFLARYCPVDYPEVETVALLHRAGFRVVERPVTMRRRLVGRSSITPLRSLYYIVKVVLALLIGQLRQPPPREGVAGGAR